MTLSSLKTAKLSIGVVAEDGREYYAISTEFNPRKADSWVRDNVLVHCLSLRVLKVRR